MTKLQDRIKADDINVPTLTVHKLRVEMSNFHPIIISTSNFLLPKHGVKFA